MSDHRRRRRGQLLLGLFTVQLLAMPLGACTQGVHDDEAAGHEMVSESGSGAVPDHLATDPTAHGGHADHEGPAPQDCVALASCSVPVVTAALHEIPLSAWVESATGRFESDRPIQVDLRAKTPPPKI